MPYSLPTLPTCLWVVLWITVPTYTILVLVYLTVVLVVVEP